jgi:penicillin-binding protein 1A
MRLLLKIFAWLSVLGVVGMIAAGGFVWFVIWHFSRGLDDVDQLAAYEPPIATRVYASDGRLMAEYARQNRQFVPIAAIPSRVVNAFLAAEDSGFYEHGGIDYKGIARAVVRNLQNLGTNRRPEGASTITQQVAKNFLLTNEVSYERKIKEAILATRIEKAFGKDHILELYLNEIYLGQGAYGVASAAITYFDKALKELSVEEAAFLAALPKAPNNYNPYRFKERATERRNYVIDRMEVTGRITPEVAEIARKRELRAARTRTVETVAADWFAEEVRREVKALYGDNGLYDQGYSVQTTVVPALQEIAESALRKGLVAYDRRHGYRGPLARFTPAQMTDWRGALVEFERPQGIPDDWRVAVVLGSGTKKADLGFLDGSEDVLTHGQLKWAAEPLEEGKVGATPKRASDVLSTGDLVLVGPDTDDAERIQLRQIPKIDGAVVALDPHTGRVLAMVGGFSNQLSEFNRATQAARQPGSAFKPFVYAAALEKGFTPSSIILDAPFVIDQGGDQGKWKPSNYTNRFYGPSTLRLGIEKSRNLMTVRLAQKLGMPTVVDYAKRFGIYDTMPAVLSYSLGAGETTLLKLTAAYAMLVNGGREIDPVLVDRIQDRRGVTVLRPDILGCGECGVENWTRDAEPQLPDARAQVVSPATAYQVVSMLEGVVRRGTGVRVAAVGKPLGGKTGTTNESRDAWFVGFSPDLALGVFTGFDTPAPLGKKETGSSVAAPIFRDVMAAWLANKPAIPFRVPPDVRLVRVDAKTGVLASRSSEKVIMEAFKPGTEPKSRTASSTPRQVNPTPSATPTPFPASSKPARKLTDGVY